MFYHPGHLDRWIPSYNGAIKVVEVENVPEPPEPVEPEELQPQPIETPIAAEPGEQRSMLRLLFPREGETVWKPVIVDVFKHEDSGIGDPVSYTIESPTVDPNTGYTYEISDVKTGVYDLVFTDAASISIIYDITDREVDDQLEVIDLRQNMSPESEETVKTATVILRFPKEQGLVWRPLIVDVFKHEDDTVEEPISFTIKIPSHGPDGGYIYEIPELTKGVYDFVFTDAASQSVIQDVSNYVIDQKVEIIDLRRNRALYDEQETTSQEGFGVLVKNFFQKILSKIWS
jgi:hypothetical protein